jgi:hypothetical protein
MKEIERRDPAEVLGSTSLPEPIAFASQRDFVRKVLAEEVDLRAAGTQYVPKEQESRASLEYRDAMNAAGSPSETVASGYVWRPGGELAPKVVNIGGKH